MGNPVPIMRLYKDEENVLPLFLEDLDGNPATGLPDWAVSARYTRLSDLTFVSLDLDSDSWKERGYGLYALSLPASVPDEEGMFGLVIEPPASGYPIFQAYGHIERRVEDYIRDASVTGAAALNTVERALYDAGNRFETYGIPKYDFENGILSIKGFLQRNGLLVDDPTSFSYELRDEDDALVSSDSSSSPSSDGIFTIEKDPQDPALVAKEVYSLKVSIVHDGVTYTSGAGAVTFN